MSDWWTRPAGFVKDGDFGGWHYRVQFDHNRQLVTIPDGSMLVLVWPPDSQLRPLPARLAYIKPESLDPATCTART